jgi:hypothetical protein
MMRGEVRSAGIAAVEEYKRGGVTLRQLYVRIILSGN